MLITDFHLIGNRLLAFRKKAGMTQAEIAEAAGLSDRTYADIERGTVNMRIETLLKICEALKITPDDILAPDKETHLDQEGILKELNKCSESQRKTALKLLEVYLASLR